MAELFDRKKVDEVMRGRSISINPKASYKRKDFVSASGGLEDAQDYLKVLSQDAGNESALQDTCSLLMPGNPRLLRNRGAEAVRQALESEVPLAEYSIARYSEKNSLLDKLDAEQLLGLTVALANPENPRQGFLYKTGNKEHDRQLEIVSRFAALQTGKTKSLEAEVAKLMQDAPEWHKAIFARYQNDASYWQDLMASYSHLVDSLFQAEFTKKAGKKKVLDKDRLHKFLKENIGVVDDKIDDEESERKKLKIWDKSLKQIYLEIARTLYQKEKPDQRLEDNPPGERKKRKRKNLGIKE